MFLLFLIGLGAANVNAQVRIGGNTAPNAAAALDLNATDATNNGTKGLALPRVNLTSNTMQLTTGVTNLTGMLIYNTTATLGAVGIYVWTGAQWTKANLPNTSAADSGKFLMSNGTSWVVGNIGFNNLGTIDTMNQITTPQNVTWQKVFDTIIVPPPAGFQRLNYYLVRTSNVTVRDVCVGYLYMTYWPTSGGVGIIPLWGVAAPYTCPIRCYRPSL